MPACGKALDYREIEAQMVPERMASGRVTIRWLISKDDGAQAFYMRLFEMEPDSEIKEHSHPWEHEIFVLEGDGVISIEDKEYRVKAGTVVFIPPNVRHYYKSGSKGMSFICVIPAEPTAREGEIPEYCKR